MYNQQYMAEELRRRSSSLLLTVADTRGLSEDTLLELTDIHDRARLLALKAQNEGIQMLDLRPLIFTTTIARQIATEIDVAGLGLVRALGALQDLCLAFTEEHLGASHA